MKVPLQKYKSDPLYSKIVQAVARILAEKDFASPIDLFQALGLLRDKDIEDWRFGRVPFLEKVILCNLSKASRILQIFRYHVHDLDMKPSMTVYVKYGKGPKINLRFTKTGEKNIEEAYSRHFLVIRKKPFETEDSPETPVGGGD